MADETEAAAEGAEHGADAVATGAEHAGDAAHAADAANGATGMPQLDITIFPNLIFWLLISIGGLYLILTRVALPRISTVLTERHDAIANDIEQAQNLKRRSEEAEAAYTAALAKARDEAHQIAADTKAQINKELARLMEKADAEIGEKTAESEGRIAEIRESATQSVEEVARETAVDIVDKLLPGAADREAVNAAIASRVRG